MVFPYELGSLVLLGIVMTVICASYWKKRNPGPTTGELIEQMMEEALKADYTVTKGNVQKVLNLFPPRYVEPIGNTLKCHKATGTENRVGLILVTYDALVPKHSDDEEDSSPTEYKKVHIEEIRLYLGKMTSALTFETPLLIRVAYNDKLCKRDEVLSTRGGHLAGEVLQLARQQQQSLEGSN